VLGADPVVDRDAAWHRDPEIVRTAKSVKLRGVRTVRLLAVGALPSFAGVSSDLARSTLLVAPSMENVGCAYEAAKQGGIVGRLKQAGLMVSAGVTFARLFFLPAKRHELPREILMQPAW
jgi:hypothetical protein